MHNDSCADVAEVRALTRWRHLSLDKQSALEITEVLQLEMTDYSEGVYAGSWDSWKGWLARPWPRKYAKEKRSKGEFPRWYEAAVVSLQLEALCQQNSSLKVGEKADWDAEDLRADGILSTLYRPALQMVRKMDHVGRMDDNNLSREYGPLLFRANDRPRHVPGVSPVWRRGVAATDVPRSDTASIRSGATTARGSSATRGPSRSEGRLNEGFW